MTIEVTLKLPEELVRDAREFGLLDQYVMTTLLQAELDRRVNELVNEEIHAYRAEKRAEQKPEEK